MTSMIIVEPIASRRFEAADQQFFARLSGDWNPIHVDPIAARRTQAGSMVVHGMHSLLWSLEALAPHLPAQLSVASLKATFRNFLSVSDEAHCILISQKSGSLKWQVLTNGVVAFSASAVVTETPAAPLLHGDECSNELSELTPANDVTFEQAAVMRGTVPFAVKTETLAAAFPAVARIVGPEGVAVIACSTKLVGMVCPGLHSVYSGLSLAFHADKSEHGELKYEVVAAEKRYGLLEMSICGPQTTGTIEALMRPAPFQQPRLLEIAALVHPGEFTGDTALVIGASRGLGELTAKLIAAGSGRIIATYASGRDDAEALAQEVHEFGGDCQILKYDARLPPEDQLNQMKWPPTQLFYFATPTIYKQKSSALDHSLLETFLHFYAFNFSTLCRYLLAQTTSPISVYYPSSVFIDFRPDNFTEYAIAKAAGEIVCDDLNKLSPKLKILDTRLPRLATDQTSAISGDAPPSALSELITIIRKLKPA